MIFATTNYNIMDMKKRNRKSQFCNSIKQINSSTEDKSDSYFLQSWLTVLVDYNVDHVKTVSLCMEHISWILVWEFSLWYSFCHILCEFISDESSWYDIMLHRQPI